MKQNLPLRIGMTLTLSGRHIYNSSDVTISDIGPVYRHDCDRLGMVLILGSDLFPEPESALGFSDGTGVELEFSASARDTT